MLCSLPLEHFDVLYHDMFGLSHIKSPTVTSNSVYLHKKICTWQGKHISKHAIEICYIKPTNFAKNKFKPAMI